MRALNISLQPEWVNGEPAQGVVIKDFFTDLKLGLGLGDQIRRDRHFLLFYLIEVHVSQNSGGPFDSDRLNIFFTGNIKVELEPGTGILSEITANTVDPWRLPLQPEPHPLESIFPGESLILVAHILINDQGGHTGPPQFLPEDHVLEHELAHWFLRQEASQFPETARYDDHEHIPCPEPPASCDVPYIMKQLAPHPLRFWDDPAAGICESNEIWTQAAYWNCWFPDPGTCYEYPD